MSVRIMSLVWEIPADRLPPSDRLVLLCLADHADDTGGRCFPGQPRIVARTGLAVRTVRSALRRLEACGCLVEVTPAIGRRTAERAVVVEGLVALAAPCRPATVAGHIPPARPATVAGQNPVDRQNLHRRPAMVAADPSEIHQKTDPPVREAPQEDSWDRWENPWPSTPMPPEAVGAAMAAYRAESRGWAREIVRLR